MHPFDWCLISNVPHELLGIVLKKKNLGDSVTAWGLRKLSFGNGGWISFKIKPAIYILQINLMWQFSFQYLSVVQTIKSLFLHFVLRGFFFFFFQSIFPFIFLTWECQWKCSLNCLQLLSCRTSSLQASPSHTHLPIGLEKLLYPITKLS